MIFIQLQINISSNNKEDELSKLIYEFERVQQDFLSAPRMRPHVPYISKAANLAAIIKVA